MYETYYKRKSIIPRILILHVSRIKEFDDITAIT